MGKLKHLMAVRLKEIKQQTAIAMVNDVPSSPRKMRLVADTVRGVEVNHALDLLALTVRTVRAAQVLKHPLPVLEEDARVLAGESVGSQRGNRVADLAANRNLGDGIVAQIERFANKFVFSKLNVKYFRKALNAMITKSEKPKLVG